MTNISGILNELKVQRDRLNDAIAALEESSNGRRGSRKRRAMSAEARARIAAAQRKRWAKQKRAAE